MIRNYFKIAWRNIFKYKLSAAINIFGLALGISSCLVLLLFVKYESSFDDGHSKAELTYRIVQHKEFPEETFYFNTTPYPLAEALRNDLPELNTVTQIVGLTTQTFGIKNNQGSQSLFEETNVLFVDSFYPKVFDNITWLAGHKATAFNQSNSIILTKDIAKKYFNIEAQNYQSIINRVISLNNKEPLLVKGVVENPLGNSNYQFGILIPYAIYKKNNEYYANDWSGNHQGTTFVVLNNKNQKAEIESKIALWKKKYLKPKDDKLTNYRLQPLSEIHTNTLYGSGPGGYVMPVKIITIAFIVAFFILLIAIVNFINLVTAQSALRSKEVGVLKVLGSNRLGLIFRFVIENSLLIIIALGLSIIIVYMSLEQLNDTLSIINLDLKLNSSHIYLILGISVVTILLATLYPAIVLSSFNPIKALKNRAIVKSSKGLTLRKSLIVFQFVIVQIFVVAVVVITLQMRFFKMKDVGFSTDTVVITPAPEFDKIDVFRSSLLSNSNVEEVSFGSGPPMGINGLSLGTSFRLPNAINDDGVYSEMKIGDANYLKFYDLKLLAGKNFTSTKDKFDQFIVNEALLESYNWTPEEAIGKKLTINEGEATIVGVVKDYHNNALQYEITPSIIINWNILQNSAFIKIKQTNVSTLSSIETAWKDSFKSSVYDYGFLDDAIAKEYAVERLIFNGFSILSILAISLGCLGLLGLMAFILMTKSKEIAIRKVLGSTVTQIATLLSKEFVILIIIAFFIAAPLAYYAVDLWLQDFTYKIELSIWMFLFGGLITLLIALTTCSFQSIKMAFANPVNSLRSE
ncbi:ABC transporter permease [uncultured Winogradskyella sp.]|uniref:ABC transporter permease n=1 Tax=uncultured Winogradskyella sp. TaxID=395353 RepID=UPI00260CABD7|nr:ABC transporter permease [uncultured Winogradskyella sp.]